MPKGCFKKKKKNSIASPSHITTDICKSTPNLLFKILNGFGMHTASSNLVLKFLSRHLSFFMVTAVLYESNEAELMLLYNVFLFLCSLNVPTRS